MQELLNQLAQLPLSLRREYESSITLAAMRTLSTPSSSLSSYSLASLRSSMGSMEAPDSGREKLRLAFESVNHHLIELMQVSKLKATNIVLPNCQCS